MHENPKENTHILFILLQSYFKIHMILVEKPITQNRAEAMEGVLLLFTKEVAAIMSETSQRKHHQRALSKEEEGALPAAPSSHARHSQYSKIKCKRSSLWHI